MRKFKPSWVTTTGPDGRTVRKYKKKYHYVCEQKGGMAQPRLSFVKTTLKSDVRMTGEKTVKNISGFSTCKEGQNGSNYSRQAGKIV